MGGSAGSTEELSIEQLIGHRNGESLGVLAVGPRRDGTFGDRKVERASAVAAPAALAVSIADRARPT
ncbi:hypothetical protein [Streptomyces sp. PSKA30]|uniref:hypothetical protein n=1 Tax=Streptomyces sp. PSKA30 TaxID=2874597 RepID=UPI001CD07BAD|nr:hypothetical protein [Streptomyces sp. PSKA30]MBZ9643771.1 hypothetical protein [Streptomyces sp. PSKA30]